MLVPVRTGVDLCRLYQRTVDVDMLNAIKSVLTEVSSVRPSHQRNLFKSAKPKSRLKGGLRPFLMLFQEEGHS